MADVGISIEGLGVDASAGSLGVVYGWSGDAPDGEGYTWLDGLVEPPTPGKDEADPRTCEANIAGFSATLHARPSIRRVLLARQDQPRYALQSSITAGDDTIDLGDAGAPPVVYAGSETMRIDQDHGDGTYSVERGFWSSSATDHDAGAGVYTRPPYYRNRLVHFWVHDGDALTSHGRGYLDDIDTADGMTKITLKIEGSFTRLQEVTRLRHNPALDCTVEVIGGDDIDDTSTRRITIDMGDFESVVAKEQDADGYPQREWYSGGGDISDPSAFAYAQIDGAIEALYDGAHYGGATARDLFEGNDFESSSAGIVDDPVYELAVWHREADVAPYPLENARRVVNNPFQPLFIAGLLIASGDGRRIDPDRLDFVSGNLGLGVDWLLGERGIEAFIELANEDRDVEIDQLVLGWDAEPVAVLDVVLFKLLLPYGYWLTPTTDGYLVPRKFEPLTVKTLAEAVGNQIEILYDLDSPPTIHQKPGYGRILQRYTALVGKTPVSEGTTIEGNAIGASARLDKMVDPKESDLDYSTLAPSRADVLADIITRQAIFLRAQIPEVTIRANDFSLEGLDYSIGKWATLKVPEGSDPVLYDDEGEDVPAESLQDHPFAMVLTGRGWNARTDAYELDGLLLNYTRKPARLIAPSVIVADVSTSGGQTTITAHTDATHDEAGEADANEFQAGQTVQLYDEAMARRGVDVLTIISATDTEVVIDGTFSSTPQDGDRIRLALIDKYEHEDFGSERGWCYLADSNDTLGSDNEEADQWQ